MFSNMCSVLTKHMCAPPPAQNCARKHSRRAFFTRKRRALAHCGLVFCVQFIN